MQYLTTTALRVLAPAARKLPEGNESLTDTADFLRHVQRLGFRPVFASQGTAHSDTGNKESLGRHIVVCARDNGAALVLLNSHTVARRTWLGLGFYETFGADGPQTLIGAAVPVRRWKGFQEPLSDLLAYGPALTATREHFGRWAPNNTLRQFMATDFATSLYLPGHKSADATALHEIVTSPDRPMAWDMMAGALAAVRKGGLPASPAHGKRRLKPVRGPDALFHGFNAAFVVGLHAAARVGQPPQNFPRFTR